MRPNFKCPISLEWVHCLQNSEVDSCFNFQLLWEPSGVQRIKSFIFPGKNCVRHYRVCVWGKGCTAVALEEPSPVCSLSSNTQFLGSDEAVNYTRPRVQCLILPSPGQAGNGHQAASSGTTVCGSSCQQFAFRRSASGSTFTFPLTSALTHHHSGLLGLRNN